MWSAFVANTCGQHLRPVHEVGTYGQHLRPTLVVSAWGQHLRSALEANTLTYTVSDTDALVLSVREQSIQTK